MQIRKHLRITKALIYVLPMFVLFGCGVWEDFTTYFNLYYDTADIFQQAESKINQQKRELFSTDQQVVTPDVNQLLIKVVEKASQILQFHAKSGYVDDALLMLGKSFYYQQNYQKAYREFNELITKQPNSSLVLESKLWLGKTEMQLKEYTDGLATLNAVRDEAIKKGRDNITRDAYVEEIKYRITQNDYPSAVDLLKKFLDVAGSGETKAEVVYETAELYVKLGDLQSAIKNYELVQKYSPTFDVLYNTEMHLGEALRSSGDNENALKIYNKMISQNKYADSLSSIYLERAGTLVKLGRMDDALEQYRTVDTAYAKTPNSGMAMYSMAQLYEGYYKNLDSAEVYYNATASSTAPIDELTDARTQVELFKRYRDISGDLATAEKGLEYLNNPEAFVKDSIEYYSELAYLTNEKNRLQNFVNDTTKKRLAFQYDSSKVFASPQDSIKYVDSLLSRNQNPQNSQFPNQNSTQQTTQQPNQFPNQNGTQPYNQQPGQNQNQPSDQYPNRNGSQYPNQSQVTQNNQQQNQPLMNRKPPVRPTLPADSLKDEIVKYEFQKGNLLFSEFNLPDTAYVYYDDILKNHSGSQYEGRTLYAMGAYYLAKGDSVKADSLFNIVYNNYKNESIVNAAADKIHKPLIDINSDPLRIQYRSAETEMDSSKYDSSLSQFYSIYKKDPSSPIAAKALFATGWILENKLLLPDSAAAVYNILIKQFPRSVYATEVFPKVNIYNQELARMDKAYQDSVKLYASKGDSSRFKRESLQQFEEAQNIASMNQNNQQKLAVGNDDAVKNNQVKQNINDIIKNNSAAANPDTLIRVFNRGIRRKFKP